jgi:hypothetical protein
MATYLREEGRLAAALGDHSAARQAYRRYLALRADADPIFQVEVRTTRSALARMQDGAATTSVAR